MPSTPDPLLDDKSLHILRHSLGMDDNGHGNMYRNHYVAGPGHHSYDRLLALVQSGHMEKGDACKFLPSGDEVFYVTEKGRAVAFVPEPPLPPAKRRWKAFRELKEVMTELSFRSFLTDPDFARYR